MNHTALFGAGPGGLYLTYLLYKAGVKNLILFDPRAGTYLRPGYLVSDTLKILN